MVGCTPDASFDTNIDIYMLIKCYMSFMSYMTYMTYYMYASLTYTICTACFIMNDAKTFFSNMLKKLPSWGLINATFYWDFVIYKFEFEERSRKNKSQNYENSTTNLRIFKNKWKIRLFSRIYSICSHFLPLLYFALTFYVQTDTGSRIQRQQIWGHKMAKKNCQFYYLPWGTCFSIISTLNAQVKKSIFSWYFQTSIRRFNVFFKYFKFWLILIIDFLIFSWIFWNSNLRITKCSNLINILHPIRRHEVNFFRV